MELAHPRPVARGLVPENQPVAGRPVREISIEPAARLHGAVDVKRCRSPRVSREDDVREFRLRRLGLRSEDRRPGERGERAVGRRPRGAKPNAVGIRRLIRPVQTQGEVSFEGALRKSHDAGRTVARVALRE